MHRDALVYHGSRTVSINGASQGLIDLGSQPYVLARVQAALFTSTTAFTLVTPTDGSLTDVFSTTSKTKFGNAIAATTANAAFGNQPAGDTLHAVSDAAADKTQDIIIYATTATGGGVRKYTARLNGTTAVNIGSTAPYDYGSAAAAGNFQTILGIELSAACTGTITLQEASADQTIKTIGAATTSVGVTNIADASQSAFGLPIWTDVSSGTKIIGVYAEPTIADGTMGEELTSATTEVYGVRSYARVLKVLWGDMANGTTATFGQYGITATSDSGLVIPHKEIKEVDLWGKRYLAWANIGSNGALANGSTADYIRLEVYG